MPPDHWTTLPAGIRARVVSETQISEVDAADLVNNAIWQADELISRGPSHPTAVREVARLLLPAFRYLNELDMVELVSCLPHLTSIIPARGVAARRRIDDFLFDMEGIADVRRGRPLKDSGTSSFADYLVSLWEDVANRPAGKGGGTGSMLNTYRIIFWTAPALKPFRESSDWDGEREIEGWLDAARRAVKRARSRSSR